MKTSQKGTGTGTGIPKTTICVNLIEIVINIFSFNLLSNCHLNHHHHLSVGRVFEALAGHWFLSRAWNRPVYADLHIGTLEITTIRTIIISITIRVQLMLRNHPNHLEEDVSLNTPLERGSDGDGALDSRGDVKHRAYNDHPYHDITF